MQVNWHYPTAISLGENCTLGLVEVCAELGIKRPLLVTDPGLAVLPLVRERYQLLVKAGLSCEVFSDIQANPTGKNVMDGVALYRRHHHDGVIALGGGSSLDAGKAIALMSGQTRPLWDFEDIGDNWSRADESGIAKVIAIPTTAGTGSEVGRASVITDQAERVKRIIFHPQMMPRRVLLDPVLTLGLPPDITAATGMDALSHNLEALCAPCYHPMAEGIALEAIRLIKTHLPVAHQTGDDMQARLHMLVASSMGATAFQRGLGAMHALAHSLGALYDKHHGLLNAILMPYVLRANRDAIEEPITRLARYLNLIDANQAGFDAFLYWVLELRKNLGIPNALSDIGINSKEAQKVGLMSVKDAAGATNPIAFNAQQYEDLFCKAVAGELS